MPFLYLCQVIIHISLSETRFEKPSNEIHPTQCFFREPYTCISSVIETLHPVAKTNKTDLVMWNGEKLYTEYILSNPELRNPKINRRNIILLLYITTYITTDVLVIMNIILTEITAGIVVECPIGMVTVSNFHMIKWIISAMTQIHFQLSAWNLCIEFVE